MGQKFTGPSGVENGGGSQVNPATEEGQKTIPVVEIERGNVEGESMIAISAVNPCMPAGVEVTIWDACTKRVRLTSDTQLYASSTSASDTNVSLLVEGADENGDSVNATVTTNGQNQVALSDLMYRVNIATVISNPVPLGDIYIAESDTLTGGVPDDTDKVQSKICQGNNITRNGFYFMPNGMRGDNLASTYISGKDSNITYTPALSFQNGVTYRTSTFPVYQNTHYLPTPGIALLEGEEFEIFGTADAGSGNAIGAVFIDGILKETT